MRRVVLESPYAGDIELNVLYARACVRDALHRGEAPLASHLLYTQEGVLRDEVPEERKLGIGAGHEWIFVAHAVVVYTDRGISPGMQQAIDIARKYSVTVERRKLGGEWALDPEEPTECLVIDGPWAVCRCPR